MLHHDRQFTEGIAAERRARAARRRPPPDAAELERVIASASRGNHAAWTALVERFTARLRAVARSHRLPVHQAEDVVQATWLALLEHIGDLRDPCAVGAWLETTARRECLRAIAAQRRERPTDDAMLTPEAAEPVNEARLVAADSCAAVQTAVKRLPSRQRELLSLLMSETEPSYADISRDLSMPVGSIGPTRERGLARLRTDRALIAAIGR